VDPLTHYFEPYISKLWTAVVQPEILVEAAQHQRKLLLLTPPRPMPMLSEPFFGLSQELSAAFARWNPHQGKLATSIRATYVRKTQEVKRVRFLAGLHKVSPDKSSEAHDPRLFFCQLQPEFSESIRQVLLELFCIAPVLEIHHEVISESRQICLSLTRRSDLLFKPKIKNKMQVDIGQDRTDHSPYTKANFQLERVIEGWRTRYSALDLRLKR
jgi:hypothetical protein